MHCEICKREIPVASAEIPLCSGCDRRVEEYAAKVEARMERLATRVEKTATEAHADLDRAHNMASVIPFGQPILVGHHSEQRDRRYRGKIDDLYRRGFRKLEKAARQAERDQAAEKNRAISSDDPAAVIKLQEKLAEAERTQTFMKEVNKAVRKLLKRNMTDVERAEALSEQFNLSIVRAGTLLAPDMLKRVGFPDYALKNNNANIRRMRQRLEELKAQAQRVAEADEAGETVKDAETSLPGISVQRDLDDNRIRLIFPGKPSAEVRAILKQRGFRWSPRNTAWQRHLNNAGEYAVTAALKEIEPLWA